MVSLLRVRVHANDRGTGDTWGIGVIVVALRWFVHPRRKIWESGNKS